MKSKIIWCYKAIFAGCFAFIVMTLFCVVYYNIPVRYPNATGVTDYKWASNSFYSRGTEGFAWGKTNNEGFVNQFDYVDGMDIDVLIIGSSHMEAFQVSQSESVAGRLNALSQNKITYNIGLSDHDFLTCCCNLEEALEHYHPSAYTVIETSRIDFSEDELNSVLDGSLPEIPNHSGGIVGLLSRNQFIRRIYAQFKGFIGGADNNENTSSTSTDSHIQIEDDSSEALNAILSLISETASKYDTKLVIFYHPLTQINSDGNLLMPEDGEKRTTFSDNCKKKGIFFLDMTDRFEYEYKVNHVLPHGFINSSVGSGHLNKYGHEMVADELLKIID